MLRTFENGLFHSDTAKVVYGKRIQFTHTPRMNNFFVKRTIFGFMWQ